MNCIIIYTIFVATIALLFYVESAEGRRCSEKHPEACVGTLKRILREDRDNSITESLDLGLTKNKKRRKKHRFYENGKFQTKDKPSFHNDIKMELDPLSSENREQPDLEGLPYDVEPVPRHKPHHRKTSATPPTSATQEDPEALEKWVRDLPRGFFSMENRMRLASLFMQANSKDEVVDRLAKAGRHGNHKPRDPEPTPPRRPKSERKSKRRKIPMHPMLRFRDLGW